MLMSPRKPPRTCQGRRQALGAGVAFLLAPRFARGARAVDYGAAIDTAGRQRMLSQRIVKAYCQIGLRVVPDLAQRELADALSGFATQLAALRKIAPDAATRRALHRTSDAWAPFRRVATGPVSRNGARELARLGEAVLSAAHGVVVALETAAGTPQARLTNIAGRQRMLSQRLAKLYMLRAWKVDIADLGGQFDSAANEFVGALDMLRTAPETTPAIGKELDAVAVQWEWFAAAIRQPDAESYALIVADASNAILTSMDLVTGMYAELARG